MLRAASIALLLVCGGIASSGQAQTPQEREQIRHIIVYGTDPCPPGRDNEIVICARRPESERHRIPQNVRELAPSPESESWTKKAERLERMGRTGVNSCSPVGPGGGTGCLEQLIRQAREERRAQGEEGKVP
jgi:hypothetical protein